MGVIDAHGAAARLMLDGGYCVLDEARIRIAAKHLEDFALAASTAPPEDEEEADGALHAPEASSSHCSSFGWEGHGWEPHSAYARAAELYEKQLRKDDGALTKAKELWEAAAECALEDPTKAKQAMRYTQRAEEAEAAMEPEEEAAVEDTAQAASEVMELKLTGDLASKFAAFASAFESPEAALDALLKKNVDVTDEADAQPTEMKDCGEVNDDIWAMLG